MVCEVDLWGDEDVVEVEGGDLAVASAVWVVSSEYSERAEIDVNDFLFPDPIFVVS
jgi:hypothetical protein